jgi:hypothetical protein
MSGPAILGRVQMRLAVVLSTALILGSAGVANAQWFEYTNREERFTVNFPHEPSVSEFTYVTEYGSRLPAKKFEAKDTRGTVYRMTVVNMQTTERDPARQGNELRGSIAKAATDLRQTGKVTLDAYSETNVIPGHQLQITLPDGSRNFVQIHLHMRRLYIMEGIAPPGAPPPAVFQASLAILDQNGNAPRYQDNNYSFPEGTTVGRGGGGGGGGAGGAAGGGAGRGGAQ